MRPINADRLIKIVRDFSVTGSMDFKKGCCWMGNAIISEIKRAPTIETKLVPQKNLFNITFDNGDQYIDRSWEQVKELVKEHNSEIDISEE